MNAEPPEPIRQCAQCGTQWLPGEDWGWKAYWTDDDPLEVTVFCPECFALEFNSD